jgi:hypothetical protein
MLALDELNRVAFTTSLDRPLGFQGKLYMLDTYKKCRPVSPD